MNFLSLSASSLRRIRTARSCCQLRYHHATNKRLFSGSAPPPVRWGILGAGAISNDFAKAVQFTPAAELAAVGARSTSRAQEFAKAFDIPKSYGSYQDLIHDPEIDVCYIGTIADSHAELATMALENKKATVVEKPATTSFRETKALIELAKTNQTFFLEGMWTRFFPAMKELRKMIAQGEIGRPIVVSGDFGWSSRGCSDDHRIFFPTSGGHIYDVAMYMAQLGLAVYERDSFGQTTAMGSTIQKQSAPVDDTTLVSCQLSKSKGFLQFFLTGQATTEERAVIQGTEGRIVVETHHIPSVLKVYKESDRHQGPDNEDGVQLLRFPLPDDTFATWNNPGSIGFTYQIEAVGKAVRNGDLECLEYTWSESLEIASLLENIRAQVLSDTSS